MNYTNEQHAKLDNSALIMPQLFLAIELKKQAEIEYTRLFELNQKKMKRAYATMYEYTPYYESGKAYYDENMREQLKTAWNASLNASMFYIVIHDELMRAVYGVKDC